MKAIVAAFNQEKALVGAFSVIVQPVVEPMDRFAALVRSVMRGLFLLRSVWRGWVVQRCVIRLGSAEPRVARS